MNPQNAGEPDWAAIRMAIGTLLAFAASALRRAYRGWDVRTAPGPGDMVWTFDTDHGLPAFGASLVAPVSIARYFGQRDSISRQVASAASCGDPAPDPRSAAPENPYAPPRTSPDEMLDADLEFARRRASRVRRAIGWSCLALVVPFLVRFVALSWRRDFETAGLSLFVGGMLAWAGWIYVRRSST